MKSFFTKFTILSLALVLLGAGCFGSSKNTATDGGIFKSVDAGSTWGQASMVLTAQGIGSIATSDIITVEMDPQDEKALYVGTRSNGMLFSYDAGASWQQPLEPALQSGLIYQIDVNPKEVCTVYVAKGQRIYKSTDCSRTYDSEVYVETRSNVFVRRVSVDWYNPDIVWVGLSNGDLMKSADAGQTWTKSMTAGSSIEEIIVSNADSRIVLVATSKTGFKKTTNSGGEWTSVVPDLKKGSMNVSRVIQNEKGTVLFAATGYGILRSTDFGSSWEPITLLTSPGQVSIKALGMDYGNPNIIYYAASSTFYRSSDGGTTWDTQRIPTGRTPQIMVVDPSDSKVLYVGVITPN